MPIDRGKLIATFLVQSEETLRGMEELLVALETHPDDEELVNAVFRGAHRLKGDAALLGLHAVSELTHVMEDLLDRLRQRKLVPTPPLVTVLLRFVDAVRELVAGVGARPGAAPASGGGAATGLRASKSVRVDTDKLDRILDTTGEIAIHRERLRETLDGGRAMTASEISEILREADPLYADLQETVMKARMVPLGPLFRSYLRTVRDLGEKLGKKAALRLAGEDVEVDTAIVEHLRDPLTHLVRNALDHGFETSEERRAAGKEPEGRLDLSAAQESGTVVVRLRDDGRGLRRAAIEKRVREMGLSADPAALPDAELYQFLFAPGFTTANRVTDLSGRGVGLDIVRRNVESLRGSLTVETEPGRWTAFTLRLPLTLAIIEGFWFALGGDVFVTPLASVAECLEGAEAAADPRPFAVMNVRGEALPVARLSALLGRADPAAARPSVLVVRSGGRRAGLVVDRLLGENQTVIKPLPLQYRHLEGIAASTILGNGRVALVLDVPALFKKITREDAAATGGRA